MPENRPDVATFRSALYSAMLTWWNAEGTISVPTKPTPTVVPRPPLVMPNSGFAPGESPFVEIDYLPGTAIIYGDAGKPIKQTPATIQAACYVPEGEGEGLTDILADRVAAMFRAIAVSTGHFWATDDPIPAPAPPAGFWGVIVRTSMDRVSQPD